MQGSQKMRCFTNPNMERAMPAEPLLTHVGCCYAALVQRREAAETEAQECINLPGRCWQGQQAAAVLPLRPSLCIAAPEPAPNRCRWRLPWRGWAVAGVRGYGLQPLQLTNCLCVFFDIHLYSIDYTRIAHTEID